MSAEIYQQLESLWAGGLGRPNVRIAILDGPVDLAHPCFVGADLREIDVLGRSTPSSPAALRHGTQVASVIFAQHQGSELRGVAPRCAGLLIPVYEEHGEELRCSHADLARAIHAAVDAGAAVINISGGELWDRGPLDKELVAAVMKAAERGSLVVAAAGNDGCQGCLHVPATLPGVIAVGATDRAGVLDSRSNHGETYQRNGVSAPGVGILTATPGGTAASASGTSFATPFVAGIAGLLASAAQQPQRVDMQLVREVILSSSDQVDAPAAAQGGFVGRINPSRAFELIQHRLNSPWGDLSMSTTADMTLPPIETSMSSTPDSFSNVAPASFEGVEPSGCGCGGQAKTPQYVYAVGQLGVDFHHETRKLSLFEHDEVNQVLGARFGRVTETVGGLLRYLLDVDVDALIRSLGCVKEKCDDKPNGDKRDDECCPDKFDCDAECATLRCLKPGDIDRICGVLKASALNGHFYDAESIQWVLRHDDCPLYVIRPSGAFAREAYQQLLIFFIEQVFATFTDFRCEFVKRRCLKAFYPCNGGTQQDFLQCLSAPACTDNGRAGGKCKKGNGDCDGGCDGDCDDDCNDDCSIASDSIAASGIEMLGEQLSCAAHVAIAGEVIGQTRLYSGEVVPVIAPALRGCANWNSKALIDCLGCTSDEIRTAVLRALAAMYEHVRNPGLAECDRAKNYWATQIFDSLGNILNSKYFLSIFGIDQSNAGWELEALKIMPGELVCRPATCSPLGANVKDVELSFFKFDNTFGGDAVISQPIDVADVVPVLRGKYRLFQRRNR